MAYETDLAFAREVMIEEATAVLGDEMRQGVEAYRQRLDRTAVDIDVREGPTVNVVQAESWVELRLRFLTGSRGRRTRSTDGSSNGSTRRPTV